MKLRITNQKDFAAGVIYLVAGAGFGLGALNYRIGEAARMGPGWFPLWVGLLLALLGLVIAARALRPAAGADPVKPPDLRAMAWILGSVVLFGLLLKPLGLVLTLALLVIVSSLASHEFRWRGALVNTVALILFSTGVFIRGIHLQIPLWPSFLN